MSKRQLLIILGIWVIIFLFLGFPSSWQKVLAILTGVIIIAISYKMAPAEKISEYQNMPYVDHKTELPQPDESKLLKSESPADIINTTGSSTQ